MSAALQQQVFSLDARYNANRTPDNTNFRTLYIRRRSQLLRDTQRSSDTWKNYIRLRSTLLQQRYGNSKETAASSSNLSTYTKSNVTDDHNSSIVDPCGSVVPTKEAEASRAMVGGTTIAENYAFVGVYHIFDQHFKAVTMIKFANDTKFKLCCCSLDGNLSICDLNTSPPSVSAILRGHTKGITGFDWSLNNDLIVSASLDATLKLWKVSDYSLLRTIKDPNNGQILCCMFQPSNNNLVLSGNDRGELRIANVSTGRFLKNVCRIGGCVLSLTSDSSGKLIWVGNDKGEITSVFYEINGGLFKTKKLTLSSSCSVTSLSYRAWISREARNPLILANSTDNSLNLLSVIDNEGSLRFRRKFQNRHEKHIVRSTFCPIMSFRQGACVVTGSEDASVYFVDIERKTAKSVVNTLQGHGSTVLSISFNHDESLLATSDLQGLVIIWKRENF